MRALAPAAKPFKLVPFIKHCMDREPCVVFACALGGLGVTLPLIVVPMRCEGDARLRLRAASYRVSCFRLTSRSSILIRRSSMGLPTWQYDAESEQNMRLANELVGTEATWSGNRG
jgi:hypothetical protein